jgi:hypothetical protein
MGHKSWVYILIEDDFNMGHKSYDANVTGLMSLELSRWCNVLVCSSLVQ